MDVLLQAAVDLAPSSASSDRHSVSVTGADPSSTEGGVESSASGSGGHHDHIDVSMSPFLPPMQTPSRSGNNFPPSDYRYVNDAGNEVSANDAEPPGMAMEDITSPWEPDFSFLDWMAFDPSLTFPMMPNHMAPDPLVWIDHQGAANRGSEQGELEQHRSGLLGTDPNAARGEYLPQPNFSMGNNTRQTVSSIPMSMQPAPSSATERPSAERPHQWPMEWDPLHTDNLIRFPDMDCVHIEILETEDFGHVNSLEAGQTYNEIVEGMKRVGEERAIYFRPFLNGNLPPVEVLNCYIQLYFEHFHPLFPLLHKPSFDPATAEWRMVLATATIGCRYSKVPYSRQGADALQELLRRSLNEAVSIYIFPLSTLSSVYKLSEDMANKITRLKRTTLLHAHTGSRRRCSSALRV